MKRVKTVRFMQLYLIICVFEVYSADLSDSTTNRTQRLWQMGTLQHIGNNLMFVSYMRMQ